MTSAGACPPPEAARARLTRRQVAAGLMAHPTLATPAAAQRAFPERPIRFVVPFPAGSAADTLARQLTADMPALLGQPMIVENRPGANAIVGAEVVARSVPDGYAVLLGSDQIMCVNPALFARLPYDPVRGFAPVAGLVAFPYLLAVSATLPVQSVADLVALARAQTGRLSFASTGATTPARLLGEMFQRDAGIELTFVSYQTSANQLFADLLTGTISMAFYPYQAIKPHLDTGRIRALATSGIARAEWMPQLPTLHELGYRRSFGAVSTGAYVPAGTPEDRIGRITDAFRQVLDRPAIRAALLAAGLNRQFLEPAGLAAFDAAERDRYREIVALTGVRSE